MEQQKQANIRIKDDDLKGVYSNIMQITHTQEEFVLDFFTLFGQTGVLASRVIVSPSHFKRMVQALQDNIQKYEGKFGAVTPAQAPKEGIGFKPQN